MLGLSVNPPRRLQIGRQPGNPATRQQGSKAARQQGSKAARQQGSKAARQQGNKGSKANKGSEAAMQPPKANGASV
jgi:hypothetical protein